MLKRMIVMKNWSNVNQIHASDESTILMLRSKGVREFPAILTEDDTSVSLQQFMTTMDAK
jgi:hypothetical protein